MLYLKAQFLNRDSNARIDFFSDPQSKLSHGQPSKQSDLSGFCRHGNNEFVSNFNNLYHFYLTRTGFILNFELIDAIFLASFVADTIDNALAKVNTVHSNAIL